MILPAENKLILVKPFICAETLSAQNTEKTNFPKIKKSVVCVYTPHPPPLRFAAGICMYISQNI